jgi:hypothetical protein
MRAWRQSPAGAGEGWASFLEPVDHKALAHEFRKAGLNVECEKPIRISYDVCLLRQLSPSGWLRR